MGYSETLCQLCGVSFAIARLRHAGEPYEAAWNYIGTGFVRTSTYTTSCNGNECDAQSGCTTLESEDREDEHVAGPGCIATAGYNGHRISMGEMKGCRAVQALMKKQKGDWQPEPDDQNFELESGYFLTGIGDGSPDTAPLEPIEPARHGIDSAWISNSDYAIDNGHPDGLPFHPTCFEIFKKISKQRMGIVDVEGLFQWRDLEDIDDSNLGDEPTQAGQEQWWEHEPGNEYLAANPISVPGLLELLRPDQYSVKSTTTFEWPQEQEVAFLRDQPILSNKLDAKADLLSALPTEIADFLLSYLISKDIANLRLASLAFRSLPTIIFRRLLLEDMPWMWEVKDLPVGQIDWHALYMAMKSASQEIKGLKNRKRVWRYVDGVCGRIEMFAGNGKIQY